MIVPSFEIRQLAVPLYCKVLCNPHTTQIEAAVHLFVLPLYRHICGLVLQSLLLSFTLAHSILYQKLCLHSQKVPAFC